MHYPKANAALQGHTYFLHLPTLFLTPGTHKSVLNFCNLVISRILYKWSNTMYNLWKWFVLFSIIPSRSIQVMCVLIGYSFLLLSDILQYIPQLFNHSPVERNLGYLHFRLIWIKLLWIFICRFCVKIGFYLSRIHTCPRVQLICHMLVACLV